VVSHTKGTSEVEAEILGSHGDEYEVDRLLGCYAPCALVGADRKR